MNPEQEHPLNALTEQASEEERKKQIYAQKSLRTLEGDIQEAIQERNASTASMVMAEQAKTATSISQPKERRPSNFNKKLFIILASVLLVILGLGGAYYLYLQSPLSPSAPAVQKPASVPGIVSPDAQKILDMTGMGQGVVKTSVESALLNMGSGDGSILQIIPIQKTNTGTENIIGSSDFLALLGLHAPDVLSRSLNKEWMLGTYNDNGTPAPFIILTNNFFQNAYAGMIAWEKTMPDDFVNIFGYADKAAEQENVGTPALPISFASTSSASTSTLPNFASSTATSSVPSFVYTPPISSYFTIQGIFKDGVIDNKDVRAFTEPDGTILVLYSFVDNNTIVITTDENALAEIINRLEKQTFIR
jgi:hypothetical protein